MAPSAVKQTKHLALLRGVNVGGKNKLPMADLAAICTKAGATAVRTFIQSGNVLFELRPSAARAFAVDVAAAIEKKFGFVSPVILRTRDELATVPAANPFSSSENVHVAFLADTPKAAAIAALDPTRSAPDRFAVRGREIYLHLPNGVARTKLTNAFFDRGLSTVSTLRNWNTLEKLIALAAS